MNTTICSDRPVDSGLFIRVRYPGAGVCVSVEIDLGRREPQDTQMSDELIAKIASQIREKEESAALAKRFQLHKAEVITAKGAGFFDELAGELKGAVEKLNAALVGTASADWPITFSEHCPAVGARSLHIRKEAFPDAAANLALELSALRIRAELHSSAPAQAQPKKSVINMDFDLDDDGSMFVALPPHEKKAQPARVYLPSELADRVVAAIFTGN